MLYDFPTKSILCSWCSTWQKVGIYLKCRRSITAFPHCHFDRFTDTWTCFFNLAVELWMPWAAVSVKNLLVQEKILLESLSEPSDRNVKHQSRRTPKNTDNARRHSPRHVRKIQNFSSFVQPKGLWKGSSCSWIPFVTWRISTSVWGFWMGVITIICDMNTQWKRYCIWWQDQSYLLQVWSIWWIIIISLMTTINVMSMIDLIWSRQSRRRYGSIWYTDWTVSGIHEKWHDIITRII